MKKPDIAKRLAQRSGITKAQAADELDRVVNRILIDLKKRQEVPIPGLGVFSTSPNGQIVFRRDEEKGTGSASE